MLENRAQKVPNVPSETREKKKTFACLCDNHMATTRNAETPPNFVPKTLQNRAQKVPNVPSETLEKKELLPAFGITVLSRPVAFSSTHGHHSKRWNAT